MTIRPALVTHVLPNSIAAELGFEPGDRLVAINGQQPRDLIDYRYLCAEEILTLDVLDAAGKTHHLEIEKDCDDELGLEFSTALFDGLIQCNNRCPFCFIDQQPPGKRQSLYLKDDDYRLSFLYGSYLTLTNLSTQAWQRIEQLRLSPLYVSVHATEPALRIRLLKNPRAGKIMQQLQWFQTRRLQIHAQIVVCPGINDGAHLERTLSDLTQFQSAAVPAVASIAVVPVGLTRFRPANDELTPVTPSHAQHTLERVQPLQEQCRQQWGTNIIWLADEWFLIARQMLPPESHYDDYPQIGNGVGSIRRFLKQFQQSAAALPLSIAPPRQLTWVVGTAVETAFQPIVQRLNQVEGLNVTMAALPSHYWGLDIAVTGLLTGQDLVAHLQDRDLGDAILLPSLMLKQGDTCFLDDMTVEQLATRLSTPILPVQGVDDLIETCFSDIALRADNGA